MRALILSEAMKKNFSENQSFSSECQKYFIDMTSLYGSSVQVKRKVDRYDNSATTNQSEPGKIETLSYAFSRA